MAAFVWPLSNAAFGEIVFRTHYILLTVYRVLDNSRRRIFLRSPYLFTGSRPNSSPPTLVRPYTMASKEHRTTSNAHQLGRHKPEILINYTLGERIVCEVSSAMFPPLTSSWGLPPFSGNATINRPRHPRCGTWLVSVSTPLVNTSILERMS